MFFYRPLDRPAGDLGTVSVGRQGWDVGAAFQGVLHHVALVVLAQTLVLEAVDEDVHGVLVVLVQAAYQLVPGQNR